MSVAEARALLERHGLAPHRARGQNFLHDERLAAKLVRTAGVTPEDAVLEVGTGLGILTRALAAVARRVVTVEVDAGLVRALRAEGDLPPHVELLHADALQLDLPGLVAGLGPPVRIVANLPYSVATPLLRRFLALAPALAAWGVTVQREVAARLLAGPGQPGYGSLAVLHRWLAEPAGTLDLHPQCFYPVPRVVSTFVVLTPHREAGRVAEELDELERVVRAGFSHRRKTLANALRLHLGVPVATVERWLGERGLPPRARAEDLAPGPWLALARELGRS